MTSPISLNLPLICLIIFKKDIEKKKFNSVMGHLFELILKDKVQKITIYPLHRKKGSFPKSLISKIMLFNINFWIDQFKDEEGFELNSVSIVCGNHPMARALCVEMLAMDNQIELVEGDVQRGRGMSEEMMMSEDREREWSSRN